MTWAAVLLAVAVLVGGPPARSRRLATRSAPERVATISADRPSGVLAIASSLDILAACLSSGMAVATAIAAAGSSAPRPLAAVLNRAAGLLALGADPATAWAQSQPEEIREHRVVALVRLARRSASSGAALAAGVADLANDARSDAGAQARAAAERASVLIAGPLGLCYLPAFVCLGIVPVIAGLAGDLWQSSVV